MAGINDPAVRDLTNLRRLGRPIWPTVISGLGSVKATPGWVSVPVGCADHLVNPGDITVGDDDGVVAIPL